MGGRRSGREAALQILYQADWSREDPETPPHDLARQAVEQYLDGLAPASFNPDQELRSFMEGLISGVLLRKEEIDEIIKRFARGWKLERMAMVDRNILRLGIFELCYNPDIPPRVAINEAVELAKKYGDADSPAFVNGILDSVFQEVCSSKLTGR